MTPPLTFCVSCGGTGGHMFPGLATARVLQARGHRVEVWTGGKRIEEATRRAWDGPVVTIPAEGLSASPLRLPRSLLVLARVYCRCVAELRRCRPHAMLAMGSYSSIGPVLAARRLNIPVVLHEANVIPGQAIDRLSRFANVVAISFEETRDHLHHPRIELTGIPLRQELCAAAHVCGSRGRSPSTALDTEQATLLRDGERPCEPHEFTVLVMGGSQGAQRLNQLVPEGLAHLRRNGVALRVIHLAGDRDRAAVQAAYEAAGIPHTVHGFLADMASAYRAASVAVCRSGAASCAELALFGLPAILIPFPQAARNHQRANALALQSSGTGLLLDQADLTPERLATLLEPLAAAPARRAAMSSAAHARALPKADERLADLVIQIAIDSGRV